MIETHRHFASRWRAHRGGHQHKARLLSRRRKGDQWGTPLEEEERRLKHAEHAAVVVAGMGVGGTAVVVAIAAAG